jgi:hypothetical protein
MLAELKQIGRKSRPAIVGYVLYQNWRMKRQLQSGNCESLHGATHSGKSPEASLDYIRQQFDDYLLYSGLHQEEFAGRRILELGSGDNVGVALRYLSIGAREVVCLDRFYAKRDLHQQQTIYERLRDTLGPEEKVRFDEVVNLSDGIQFNPERLRCIYGTSLEDTRELFGGEPFDLIMSRVAIQDIYDPEPTFEAMDRLLVPGGHMLHKIDLSDQGMFRDCGLHPLMFLTIPERVYRRMAVDSGRPNRKLIGYYRQKLGELDYDAKILITSIIGSGGRGDMHPHKERIEPHVDYTESRLKLVQEIRPRLSGPFRYLPDEELLIDGIFIVARKPVIVQVGTSESEKRPASPLA